jgi:hypothetical protein
MAAVFAAVLAPGFGLDFPDAGLRFGLVGGGSISPGVYEIELSSSGSS